MGNFSPLKLYILQEDYRYVVEYSVNKRKCSGLQLTPWSSILRGPTEISPYQRHED